MPRFAVAVVVAHGLRRRDAVAEQAAQLVDHAFILSGAAAGLRKHKGRGDVAAPFCVVYESLQVRS